MYPNSWEIELFSADNFFCRLILYPYGMVSNAIEASEGLEGLEGVEEAWGA